MFKPTTNNHITSQFGWRLLNGEPNFHSGIDYGFRKEKGDPILTIDDGVVKVAKYDSGGYGNYVVVEHDGYCSLYAHLKTYVVKVGQKVLKYETIAEMGETGYAFGEHLHFEIRDVLYIYFWERYKNKIWKHCVDPELFWFKLKEV